MFASPNRWIIPLVLTSIWTLGWIWTITSHQTRCFRILLFRTSRIRCVCLTNFNFGSLILVIKVCLQNLQSITCLESAQAVIIDSVSFSVSDGRWSLSRWLHSSMPVSTRGLITAILFLQVHQKQSQTNQWNQEVRPWSPSAAAGKCQIYRPCRRIVARHEFFFLFQWLFSLTWNETLTATRVTYCSN